MMKSYKIKTCALALTALLGLGSAVAETTMDFAGDPCSLPLAQKLGTAFNKKKGGNIKMTMTTVKCTLGVYKAAEGVVDVGVSTQNGLNQNLPKDAVNTVIAKSPIVLVANKSNPVDNLTYEQVQGIYSGKIRNWKEVGGADMAIENVILQPCVALTMSKKVSLYAQDLERIAMQGNPVLNTNKIVAENPGALGQQIHGYHSPDVKVITIDGLLPTEKSLPEKYRFYQDYNVVTHGEPKGEVKAFIEFAQSEEGRKIIKSINHIPTGDRVALR